MNYQATVTVILSRQFRFRVWLATLLIRLAARIVHVKYRESYEEA